MDMTFDIKIAREKRFMTIASQLRTSETPEPTGGGGEVVSAKVTIPDDSPPVSPVSVQSALVIGQQRLVKLDSDGDTMSLSAAALSSLPPPSPTPSVQQHLAGFGSIQSITQHIKVKPRRQSTQSDGSDGEDDGDGGRRRRRPKTPKSPKPPPPPPPESKKQESKK